MNEVASEELVVEEPESLADKLGVAGPGDPVCYHVGTSLRPCPAARAALAAYYRGEVDLVQKRVRGSLFCYLAIKRRQVSPPNVPHALEALVANLLMEGARHARQHPRCIETKPHLSSPQLSARSPPRRGACDDRRTSINFRNLKDRT